MKFKLKPFFKRHIALIILLVILLVFPISLSSQSKLNMRIIVTGLAIDYENENYKVTAQIVRAKPGNESPGTSAEIDFVTEQGSTVSDAIAKLIFKTGKISAFSHTNFVVLGNSVVKEDKATSCLDVFVRDKIIRSSALVLFAEEDASDEIKKTKDAELSIGLVLQKVFLYKQEESDGIMVTVIDFLKSSTTFSKTAYANILSIGSDEETLSAGDESGSESGSGSGSESGSNGSESGSSESGESSSESSEGSEESSSGNGSGNASSTNGENSGGGSGGSSSPVFFKSSAPILVFVDGKLGCKLEKSEEILGFMLANPKTKRATIGVDEFEGDALQDAKVSVDIKSKGCMKKLRYEDEIPCLDVIINIENSDIVEILSKDPILNIDDDIYDAITSALQEKIKNLISATHDACKETGADVFGAYELAKKYVYKKTNKYYGDDVSKFVSNLKLNVEVNILKLDY